MRILNSGVAVAVDSFSFVRSVASAAFLTLIVSQATKFTLLDHGVSVELDRAILGLVEEGEPLNSSLIQPQSIEKPILPELSKPKRMLKPKTILRDRVRIGHSAPTVGKAVVVPPVAVPVAILSEANLMLQVHAALRARFLATVAEDLIEIKTAPQIRPETRIAASRTGKKREAHAINVVASEASVPVDDTETDSLAELNTQPSSKDKDPEYSTQIPPAELAQVAAVAAIGLDLNRPEEIAPNVREVKTESGGVIEISRSPEARLPKSTPPGAGRERFGPPVPQPRKVEVEAGFETSARAGPDGASQPPRFVEAFRWSERVDSVTTQRVSSHGADYPITGGWILAQNAGYLSTLVWERSEMSVPLISEESVAILSRVSSTPLQVKSAGLVFGLLSAGMEVSLTGRADSVFLIDDETHPGRKYFFFSNVEPGSRILYPGAGSTQASVGIPVLPGIATFVDAEKMDRRTIYAQVVSAEAIEREQTRRAKYRVVGAVEHSSTDAGGWLETDQNGQLEISNHAFLGGMSAYLDVVSGLDGFIHRYEIPARTFSASEQQPLFYFGSAKVEALVRQLDGGLNPAGGMLIAAVPGLIRKIHELGPTFPEVELLTASATMAPELYTLAAGGKIQVTTPLDKEHPRFIAVQVPEGPLVAKVKSAKPDVVWSSLQIASPALINVVM